MQYSRCFAPVSDHCGLIAASSPLTSFPLKDLSILWYLASPFHSVYHSPELYVHIPANKGEKIAFCVPLSYLQANFNDGHEN